MKLNNTFIVVFVLLSLASSLIAGLYYYSSSQNTIEEQVTDSLLSIAKSRANHITTYFNDEIEKLKLIKGRIQLKSDIANYLKTPNSELREAIRIKLNDSKNSVDEYSHVCFIGLEGKVVTCNDASLDGKDFSKEYFFINGLKEEKVYFFNYVEISDIDLAISGPVNSDGKLMGVLVTLSNLDELSKIVKDRTGMGKTGEVLVAYINKESGEIVYPFPRFFESQGNYSQITGEPMKQALFGNELIFKNTLDYRKVPVIAISQYVEIADLGLDAKIDRSEAIDSYKNLFLKTSLIAGIFIIIISIFIGFFISRIFSKPLEKLASNINQITKGNLNIQIEKSNIKEVQVLIDSLNRILTSLKLAILRTGATKEQIGLGEAIKAKKEAEEKYKGLFDNAIDAIFIADPITRQLVDCNKAAEKLINYSKDEILSMKADQLHPKDLVKETMNKFILQNQGKLKTIYTEVITKDKQRIPVSINASSVIIGNKNYSQGIFRDISKEKEIEKKYKLLYETSKDAIMTIEPPTWRFTAGNLATLKLFGIKSEKEFNSLGPWNLSPKYQPDGQLSNVKAKKMIMKAVKEGSNFFEWTHRKYKGKNFPAIVSLSRIKEEGHTYLQATVRNITKETEERRIEGITSRREGIALGREQIVGKRENVAKGRETAAGIREVKSVGKEGISKKKKR